MTHLGPPIVVTAVLDEGSQRLLDALRTAHFPPARNHLAAHLTLFHAVPWAERTALLRHAGALAQRPPIAARLAGLRSLGRGVAVAVEAADLVALRRRLAEPLWPLLTAQDRQPLRPHVTIANKLAAAEARELLALLRAGWTPRPAMVTALACWRYLGPAWAWEATVPLTEADAAPATAPVAAGGAPP